MAEGVCFPDEDRLVRIEPDDRLVVLARTMQAQGPGLEAVCAGDADLYSLGSTFIGRALYRHRSVFRSASDAPVWSHLELNYFRDVVPGDAIRNLVFAHQPADIHLLRAEILMTTPSAFTMPRSWQGTAGRPQCSASLEYINVEPSRLGAYRDVMQRYIGPAAARLVAMGDFGTYRAMETAAVLHHNASLTADWNQIHLCEVQAGKFKGFGQAFDAALREIAPDGGFAAVFAGLGAMRKIPRWTFNDAVVEADLAVARLSSSGLSR